MSVPAQALAPLFFKEMEKGRSLPPEAEWDLLSRLLDWLITELSSREALQFTTPFARTVYVAQKYRLPRPLPYYLHLFRKLRYQSGTGLDLQARLALGRKALLELSRHALGVEIPASLQAALEDPWPEMLRPSRVAAFRRGVRGVAESIDPQARCLWLRDEEDPAELKRVLYDLPDRNVAFNSTVEHLKDTFRFPVTLYLVDVEVDDAGNYRPAGFVVEPDYLVDVTAIAECFAGRSVVTEKYLLNKWLPKLPSPALLRGIAANFFLDELMGEREATFREVFKKIFTLHPLGFALLPDAEIHKLKDQLQLHWVNLKKVIHERLPEEAIEPGHCHLEPSFYSGDYGLQGRLDVFFRAENRSAIIELKSGKPFMANHYGIGVNHFVQTLLYYLLIESAYGRALDPKCYILYSGVDDNPLRYAPVVKAQQLEALQARNLALAYEWQMMRLTEGDLLQNTDLFFQVLRPESVPGIKGFVRDDLERFRRTYDQLDTLERKYLGVFSAFIAREQQLAKIGPTAYAGINGQAAIWLNRQEEKEENYEILQALEVIHNRAGAPDPTLTFRRTEQTNPLANFRVGDLVLIYPASARLREVLQHQLFKAHIAALEGEEVVVRLRSRQFQSEEFSRVGRWNLEHDHFDGGFSNQYRGLFAWASQPAEKRQLLLARRPPLRPVGLPKVKDWPGMTREQRELTARILAAEEYFLLWGPPGTGKTSVMLRQLVRHLMEETEEHLLLLAYTHRAVDEMCDAIGTLPEPWRSDYLRIGSKYNTAERFRDKLLDVRLEGIGSRRQLVELIRGSRIILATVASMAGRPELLQLKPFDRMILDEASQVLEPSLVGLLPHCQRFVLIGDHKQLPAVVTQSPEESEVGEEELRAIGLTNARNSLFERLYLQAQEQGWHWAYGQLSHQGRMHREIMAFPNRHFYGSSLKILPPEVDRHLQQMAGLSNTDPNGLHPACRQRVYFLDTPVEEGPAHKTNRFEAEAVARLIGDFGRLYGAELSLGVITPYRAQIAQVRKALLDQGIDPEAYTVDTVERYQGGARDVILLSLCTNSPIQLASLVSLSNEGVDRKLNVALTRAREHLVILGNAEVLGNDPLYRKLVARFGSKRD